MVEYLAKFQRKPRKMRVFPCERDVNVVLRLSNQCRQQRSCATWTEPDALGKIFGFVAS